MNVTPLTELATNDVRVRLNQIETPKGERLEIETPTSSIRLDAVALEALTWQENAKLADLLGANGTGETVSRLEQDGELDRTRLMTVSNEFGFVVVYENWTGVDAWIDIDAEKQGESIHLHPAELEAIARQDHTLFTELIKIDLNM